MYKMFESLNTLWTVHFIRPLTDFDTGSDTYTDWSWPRLLTGITVGIVSCEQGPIHVREFESKDHDVVSVRAALSTSKSGKLFER